MRTLWRGGRPPLLIALALLSITAALGHGQSKPLTIGVLVTKTGPFAGPGQEIVRGAELAADVAKERGLGTVVAKSLDDKDRPDGARVRSDSLLKSEKALAIVGPTTSVAEAAVTGLPAPST